MTEEQLKQVLDELKNSSEFRDAFFGISDAQGRKDLLDTKGYTLSEQEKNFLVNLDRESVEFTVKYDSSGGIKSVRYPKVIV